MFRGLTAIIIDAKGRMAIPARYRDALASSDSAALVVTIDTEQRCLLLYPQTEWEVIEAKLTALPSFNPDTRRIQRLLMGHATELDMDRSGRILLPGLLREYAGLGADVILVGQGQKFEIWGATAWETARETWLLEEQEKDVTTLSSELLELSI